MLACLIFFDLPIVRKAEVGDTEFDNRLQRFPKSCSVPEKSVDAVGNPGRAHRCWQKCRLPARNSSRLRSFRSHIGRSGGPSHRQTKATFAETPALNGREPASQLRCTVEIVTACCRFFPSSGAPSSSLPVLGRLENFAAGMPASSPRITVVHPPNVAGNSPSLIMPGRSSARSPHALPPVQVGAAARRSVLLLFHHPSICSSVAFPVVKARRSPVRRAAGAAISAGGRSP